MKKILTLLIVLLLLAGGAAWYFINFRMDSMLEERIETLGSMSLGSAVSVGEVKTSIKDGSLKISDVTIANPPGFKNSNAIVMKGIEAAVDYGSLDIRRLVIENPEIIIEEMGGETNFSVMMAALEQEDSGAAPPPVKEGKPEPVIMIRHFRMNGSRAAFESESLNRYTDVKVDAIEMTDLKGTPTELSKVIAARILKEISREAATEMLKAQTKKKFKDTKVKVREKLKDLLGDDEEDSGNSQDQL
jgi:hypothetical protein